MSENSPSTKTTIKKKNSRTIYSFDITSVLTYSFKILVHISGHKYAPEILEVRI